MNHAAAELSGSHCRIVSVGSGKAAERVVAHQECTLDERAPRRLREFRDDNGISSHLRVVLWPGPEEAGVTAITAKPGAPLSPPSTLAVRERVGSLLRAGFLITNVSLPHQILAELALQQGATLALAAAFHGDGGCISLARDGRAGPRPAYLRWDAQWCRATAGSGDALARYQFAAAFAPHLRQVLENVSQDDLRILACGSMANLRTAMAPFSEEFGREVQVLDHAWPGMLDAEAGTIPTDPAVWQLARAAAQSSALGLHR